MAKKDILTTTMERIEVQEQMYKNTKMETNILPDGSTTIQMCDNNVNYIVIHKNQENSTFSHHKSYKYISDILPKRQKLLNEYSKLNSLRLIYKIMHKLHIIKKDIISMETLVLMINGVVITSNHLQENSKSKTTHIINLSKKLKTVFLNSLNDIDKIFELEKELKINFNTNNSRNFMNTLSTQNFIKVFLSMLIQLKHLSYRLIKQLIKLRFNVLQENNCVDLFFISYTVHQLDCLMNHFDNIADKFMLHQYHSSAQDKVSHQKLKELSFSVNGYIKLFVESQYITVARQLTNTSSSTFYTLLQANEQIENEQIARVDSKDHNVYESRFCCVCSRLLLTKSKYVCKKLRKSYLKIISDEQLRFNTILVEILDINKEIFRKNSKALFQKGNTFNRQFSLNSSNKLILWSNPFTPIEQDYLKKLYQEELWLNIRNCLHQVYISEVVKDTSKCFCRLNNLTQSNIERDCIWRCKVKLSEDRKVSSLFVQVLSELIMTISMFHNSQHWDNGFNQAISLALKDRFRYKKETNSASSNTINILLQNQTFIQDQLKVLHRKDMALFHYNKPLYHKNILISLHLFCCFMKITLHSKRQQYLSSASWEPFFVVSSLDLKMVIYYLDRLLQNLKSVFPHIENEGSMLFDYYERVKLFEDNSFKLLVHTISDRSKQLLHQNMPNSKTWRRRGSSVDAYQANSYVTVAVQSLFSPILESFTCLSRMTAMQILCRCISAFVKNWMEHILNQQFVFSIFGCQQLLFDFQYFLQCFEHENFGLSIDEFSDIQSLPVISQMKNAVILLSCQPQRSYVGRRESSFSTNGELNGASVVGSTQSILSQVSIESVTGSEFNDIIDTVELHDKDRWLALRAKGGHTKRTFLCIK